MPRRAYLVSNEELGGNADAAGMVWPAKWCPTPLNFMGELAQALSDGAAQRHFDSALRSDPVVWALN